MSDNNAGMELGSASHTGEGIEVRFQTYDDVREALLSPDLAVSLDPERYERGNILEDVVYVLHGADHDQRLRHESQLFKRDLLSEYQTEFRSILDSYLPKLAESGHANLPQLGSLLLLPLVARIVGIDLRTSSINELHSLEKYLAAFAQGALIMDFPGETERIKSEVVHALGEFERDYFLPSAHRRRALIDRSDPTSSTSIPSRDLLTLLLHTQDKLRLSDEQIMREIAFYFESGVETNGQSLTIALHYIFAWLREHPDDYEKLANDVGVIQRFVHEALRLHPIRTELVRKALRDTTIAGRVISAGSIVLLDEFGANHDPTVFGERANEFNPFRRVRDRVPRYGITFGGGMHTCIGRVLAAGPGIREGNQATPSTLGTVTLMIQALLKRGIRADPSESPTSVSVERWHVRWVTYPVLLET